MFFGRLRGFSAKTSIFTTFIIILSNSVVGGSGRAINQSIVGVGVGVFRCGVVGRVGAGVGVWVLAAPVLRVLCAFLVFIFCFLSFCLDF